MRGLAMAILVSVALGVSPAARAAAPSPVAAVLAHLRLRRSLDDQALLAKPADLSVTWPAGRAPTFAVDAALSATACAVCRGEGVELEVAGGVGYHRDTELSSRTDLLTAGLTGELYLGHLADPVSHDLKLSLEYHRNAATHTQGLVAYLDYVPLGPLAIGRIWPRPTSGLFRVLAVEWAPTVSVEYRAALDGAGQAVRLRVSAQVRLYLAPRALGEQLYLHLSGDLRETVFGSIPAEPTGHRSHLLVAGLTGYVDPGHHAALSLEYRDGVDPRVGQAGARYLRLTLSLEL